MLKTESYRRHHHDIRLILSTIEKEMDITRITDNPEVIAVSIRQLFGKFSTHLAIEDKVLYPKALAHNDNKVRKTANDFQTEMGGLGETFDQYRKTWPGPVAIAKSPEDFATQTRHILDLLVNRLNREEVELYTLIDRAG
ncbi:hemerythrin domain-containing protein [Terasakiella sp. A23]|uniref:hemerythrin domain-containing protein n=1 Tax=Terasakiella sp. FCG-A23 TaxID=3080561 RepID=UPI00295400FA|nr:hemerythrin domain-containing protein [Terasakiella sp. A23]MDV7338326.1 hemerythrin domain-containing protein [Terasakiella sp. A23]